MTLIVPADGFLRKVWLLLFLGSEILCGSIVDAAESIGEYEPKEGSGGNGGKAGGGSIEDPVPLPDPLAVKEAKLEVDKARCRVGGGPCIVEPKLLALLIGPKFVEKDWTED